MLKVGSLCTGYGGLDMAVEAFFNAETVWCAEFDKHASKLIEQRFNIPNYGDIKNIDWASIEPIDILTAGYPCQPFSHAGYRKGTNDERHIFPYILEAISILRPRWVILENVRGHLSLGLKEVLEGLASEGYDARWQVIRASDVGAPHQRARIFIIAYPNSKSRGISSSNQPTSNSSSIGLPHRHTIGLAETFSISKDNGCSSNSDSNGNTQSRRTDLCLQSASAGLHGWENQRKAGNEYRFSLAMDRQEVPDTLDQGRLNPLFVEYMMGLPKGWVTDMDLLRSQKLKMLGNGVVPQQAYKALELLTSVDN
jgi:DNA (cytosine-5)-methyltransferase 1